MNHSNSGRILRSALVGALCALFFLLAMGITLLSGSVYRNVAADAQARDTHRTALSYLLNQVRRCADTSEGQVLVGTFGGADTLVLPEGDYLTLLYCYDGALRELYTQSGSGLTAEDGIPILALDGLDISLSDGLVRFSATAGEASYSASIAPRCGVRPTGEVTL